MRSIRSLAMAGAIPLGSTGSHAVDFAGGRSDHFDSEKSVALTVLGLGAQTVEVEGPVTVVLVGAWEVQAGLFVRERDL